MGFRKKKLTGREIRSRRIILEIYTHRCLRYFSQIPVEVIGRKPSHRSGIFMELQTRGDFLFEPFSVLNYSKWGWLVLYPQPTKLRAWEIVERLEKTL